MYSFRISSIFLSVFLIVSVSCSGDLLRIESEWDRKFRYAFEKHNSPRWTERVEAVRVINDYLYDIRKTDYLYVRSSEDYIRLAEIIIFEASNDIHRAVRIEAIEGLVLLNSKIALSRLREIASEEKDSDVRWTALQALGLYRDPESSVIFARAYESDDWLVREAAIKGLLSIGDTGVKRKHISVIKRAVNDRSTPVRIAALENIDFQDERLYRHIASNLFGEGRSRAHTLAALKAINGYIIDDRLKIVVIDNYLTHRDTELRLAAFRVLRSDRLLAESGGR